MIYDTIDRLDIYSASIPDLKPVISELAKLDLDTVSDGTYYTSQRHIKYMVQSYQTVAQKDYEIHKKFIDIQMVISGREYIDCAAYTGNYPESFNESTDFGALSAEKQLRAALERGVFALVFPGEPHCPGLSVTGASESARKIVFKLPWPAES